MTNMTNDPRTVRHNGKVLHVEVLGGKTYLHAATAHDKDSFPQGLDEHDFFDHGGHTYHLSQFTEISGQFWTHIFISDNGTKPGTTVGRVLRFDEVGRITVGSFRG